jgi:hypothetical protein
MPTEDTEEAQREQERASRKFICLTRCILALLREVDEFMEGVDQTTSSARS